MTPVRQEPTEDTLKVQYHVFDCVNFNEPFALRYLDRIAHGQTMISWADLIFPVRTYWDVEDAQHADSLYAYFVSEGYEGMMYRLGDCPYTVPKQMAHCRTNEVYITPGTNSRTKFLSDKDNRCWHLLKRKDWQDDEFTCLNVQEGEGKLKGTLGALICSATGEHLLSRTFSVGSGLTDSERAHYWLNPPIGRLIKVKYLVLSEAGIPLNPTILAIL